MTGYVDDISLYISKCLCLFKPKETVLISETAGLWKAEDVAKKIVNDSLVSFKTGLLLLPL